MTNDFELTVPDLYKGSRKPSRKKHSLLPGLQIISQCLSARKFSQNFLYKARLKRILIDIAFRNFTGNMLKNSTFRLNLLSYILQQLE